ncbi:hypothetical protein CASFOL_004711 [Castilleja foliolosa]|uniref:RNase H type-1 domain-containing protein n=1 Tax=Castilleja foliolosa TaxID=1961234 RepID=A0ABD3EFA9_9LAMI
MESLNNIKLDFDSEDQLIYTKCNYGVFSIKRYIQDGKTEGTHLPWGDLIWNKHLPANQGAFLWRLINRALLVDAEIQKKGINVWDFVGTIFKRQTHYLNITHFFNVWMQKWNINSQGGITALNIFGWGMWEIWRSRCTARFEDKDMNYKDIIKKVQTETQLVNLYSNPKIKNTVWEKHILDYLMILIKEVKHNLGNWIWWKKPARGGLKLYTDGAFKNNIATAGGIVRNEEGVPIFCFWGEVEAIDSDSTEIEAINMGIDQCNLLGLSISEIETDSSSAFTAFRGKNPSPNLSFRARKHKILGDKLKIIHREQNMVADLLAKYAREAGNGQTLLYKDLPSSIKLQIFYDKIGLHVFRKKK